MTKELLFDLEFNETGVEALSLNGNRFMLLAYGPLTGIYDEAVRVGLHVRFTSKEVRDRVIRQISRTSETPQEA